MNQADSLTLHTPSVVGAPTPTIVRDHARLDIIVLSAVAVVALAALAFAVWAPIPSLIFRITDDAFYYLTVARNIVLGHGITFDGINATNGFHPLWMLMLLPVYAAAGGDPVIGLRGAYCLVIACAAATLWLAYRTTARYSSRPAAAVAVCTMVGPWFLNSMINGLETGIMMLWLFVVLWAVHRWDLLSPASRLRGNVLLGLILAILFLCRLDTVFIVIATFVFMGVRCSWGEVRGSRWRPAIRKWLEVGIPALVGVIPFFLWNYTHFGHFVPISGALKTTFPVVSFSTSRLGGWHSLFGRVELLFSIAMLFLIVWWRKNGSAANRISPLWKGSGVFMLLAVCTGCVLHYLNTILFMNWATYWWHYSSYIPMSVVLLGVAISVGPLRFLIERRFTGLAAGVLVVAAVAGQLFDARRRGDHHGPWYEGALWCRAHLPKDAVVAMTDCGLFGYFCDRPTVNLDGVINGYEFQTALKEGRFSEYLRRCGVTHLADHEAEYRDGRYVIRIPARLYKQDGGAIVIRESTEAFRSKPYRNAYDNGIYFSIWNLSDLCIVDDYGAVKQTGHWPCD